MVPLGSNCPPILGYIPIHIFQSKDEDEEEDDDDDDAAAAGGGGGEPLDLA